jgi:alkaline phosphatase
MTPAQQPNPVNPVGATADHIRELQASAVEEKAADWGFWGTAPDKYSNWTTHSNRLIPAYTFGVSLGPYKGANSVYRSAERLSKIYYRIPDETVNAQAEYFDQTDIFRLQRRAFSQGKKYVVLIIFDGMDWVNSRCAAIAKSGKVEYTEGRGTGLYFQDYRGVNTDFGYFCSAPHNDGTQVDIDHQTLKTPDGETFGGYNALRGGPNPWTSGNDLNYLIGKTRELPHPYTDSAASATSLMSGVKTYNNAINVSHDGREVISLGRELQQEGYSIGVLTSVPFSHATPACAYAVNVHRDDYQDLSRDLLGLPSISHPVMPLPGVDVLMGGGWGENYTKDDGTNVLDPGQGNNFVPGNRYITTTDVEKVDVSNGGKYRIAQRRAGVPGSDLQRVAQEAAHLRQRLLAMYGVKGGHLPFRTADGAFNPTASVTAPAEEYSPADLAENPNLADMTKAALTVLQTNPQGFWMMIEAGDVDWANHANNMDNSIGAIFSGDDAFRAVCDWAESHKCWDETAVIVTADHGHYFHLVKPDALIAPAAAKPAAQREQTPPKETVKSGQ